MSTTSAHLYKRLRAGAREHITQEFLKGCPVNSDLSRFKESERLYYFPIIIKCELLYEE